MKYEFGIMSSKYSLEAEKDIDAKLCMCLFFKKSALIAIYYPKEESFYPTQHMRNMIKLRYVPKNLNKIMSSIKKIK